MAHFDHQPSASQADEHLHAGRNARYGLILFAVYASFYVTFMLLNAFWPQVMDTVVFAGINLAVVYGRVTPARGNIAARLRVDGDRRRVVVSATGAESLTRFIRLARSRAPRCGVSVVKCRLVTGRRHQIRVHLASRGWPIVGDPKYGEPRWMEIEDDELRTQLRSFSRQALHA